jgi:hypothetical protein
MRVSWTICLNWPQTAILLISASQVARITGVRHWHPANMDYFVWFLHNFKDVILQYWGGLVFSSILCLK